jgi:hypothetical protein
MSIFQHILTYAVLYCTMTTLQPISKRKLAMKLNILSFALLAMMADLAVAQDVSIRYDIIVQSVAQSFSLLRFRF